MLLCKRRTRRLSHNVFSLLSHKSTKWIQGLAGLLAFGAPDCFKMDNSMAAGAYLTRLALLSLLGLTLHATVLAADVELHTVSHRGRQSLDLRLYYPPDGVARRRAVLFVPGSAGGVQPERDASGQSDPMHALSTTLAAGGALVAAYSTRGLRDPLRCLTAENSSPEHYLLKCTDHAIRKHTTFYDATEDALASFRWFEAKVRQLGIHSIDLVCASEGVYHCARMIHRQRLKPRSLTVVSGPLDSPRAVLRWQSTHEYTINLVEDLVGKSSKGFVWDHEVEQAATQFGLAISAEQVRELFRINAITLESAAAARVRAQEQFRRATARIMAMSPKAPAIPSEEGAVVFFSVGRFQEMVTDRMRPRRYLRTLERRGTPIKYFFGVNDPLIPIWRYRSACAELDCTFFDGVGHALERPDKTLDLLAIQAIAASVLSNP